MKPESNQDNQDKVKRGRKSKTKALSDQASGQDVARAVEDVEAKNDNTKIEGCAAEAPSLDKMSHQISYSKNFAGNAQGVVPVFVTLMIKKIKDQKDEGIYAIGTLLQRPQADLQQYVLHGPGGTSTQAFFDSRINDGEEFASECFSLRKSKNQTDHHGTIVQTTNTFDAKLPLIQYEVFQSYPFRIVALETTIEFASFFGKLGEQWVHLRPNILCHNQQRNLVSIRDPSEVDKMHVYDFVTPNPTVEVHIEHKGGDFLGYVPKLRLTWYVTPGWAEHLLLSIVPACLLSMLNYVNTSLFNHEVEVASYYSNASMIGLALITVIQSFISHDSFKNSFQVGHLYGIMLLLGLIAAVIGGHEWFAGDAIGGHLRDGERCRLIAGTYLSNIFMLGSCLVPIFSSVRYYKVIRRIKSAHTDDTSSFLVQRENKPSDHPEDLHGFFEQAEDDPDSFTRSRNISKAWRFDEETRTFSIGFTRQETEKMSSISGLCA